ncbi:hypothetical protein [Palleronia sp. THAF1]|uniref:hypothetical protein n=1 Tax=Palleronia sp. THAF1 TaxID=2587842 RepID=UPI000F521A95|nr:hypothetical protein [Palleronia sp. THAF1]
MSRAPVQLRKRLDAATYRRAAQAKHEDFIVFLAGPFIDPTQPIPEDSSPATKLRYELYSRLTDEGHLVSLGEYKDVINAYKDELGSYHNAAIAEIGHATESAHAVVMIVDSPGSFAEIGAFSMKEEICRKMIVISDIAHEGSDGYVRNGPVILSESFGAEVRFVDLSAVDLTEHFIKQFLAKLSQKHRAKLII